jgi:hypothetical protein
MERDAGCERECYEPEKQTRSVRKMVVGVVAYELVAENIYGNVRAHRCEQGG